MTATTTNDPYALMSGLILEDGEPWGARATSWQKADAQAVLDHNPTSPRMHFLTRPRGGSKTTDTAGVALVALLTQAPAGSTSHAYARDRDQAGLLLDALRGLATRSGVSGLLDFTSWAVTVKSTGARLLVESADAASAHGHIPYMVIVDELGVWPSTREARGLWEGLVSGLPKRADSRLVVITTASDPAHWSAKVIGGARRSPSWRVSEVPGPLPWVSPEDLAEQRRLLPASSFDRLHLNRWTSGEDRLVSDADLAACVAHSGPLEYRPGHKYVVGVDVGLKADRTAIVVAHSERSSNGPPIIVVDRVHVLEGTRAQPVQLADIESVILECSRIYHQPTVLIDPWQAVGTVQRLRSRVRISEWSFTQHSVGRLAANLHVLLREHRVRLPNDADLLDELGNVRLRETAPGIMRMDHDSGHHDDRAIALALAALELVGKADHGSTTIQVPKGRRPELSLSGLGDSHGRPSVHSVRAARSAEGPASAYNLAMRGLHPGQRRGGSRSWVQRRI